MITLVGSGPLSFTRARISEADLRTRRLRIAPRYRSQTRRSDRASSASTAAADTRLRRRTPGVQRCADSTERNADAYVRFPDAASCGYARGGGRFRDTGGGKNRGECAK